MIWCSNILECPVDRKIFKWRKIMGKLIPSVTEVKESVALAKVIEDELKVKDPPKEVFGSLLAESGVPYVRS
jgi:hypothetical protein